MRNRTLTTIRCVPRYGYDYAEVRTVDLELPEEFDESRLAATLERWFAQRGVESAVYDIQADDNGFFAVVNDEAYQSSWGKPLL